MTNQGIERVLAAIGMVMMIGFPLQIDAVSAADSTTTPTDSTSDNGDVQSRGLTLPKLTPPPPPPVQLPSTVPVVDSFRFTRRPPCDTRSLQAYQAAKPCVRATAGSTISDPSAFHELQIKGRNLLGATVSIVNGPNDIPIRPGRIPGVGSQVVDCPAGFCIEIYLETFQATQRGQRTLMIKNPQGQSVKIQIEVVDGHVINVPSAQPGRTAQPLPPCPKPSPNPSGPTGVKPIPCQ